MTGIAMCILAFIAILIARQRSRVAGLIAVFVVGYGYGMARVRSQLLQVSTRPTRSSMASRIVPVSWK